VKAIFTSGSRRVAGSAPRGTGSTLVTDHGAILLFEGGLRRFFGARGPTGRGRASVGASAGVAVFTGLPKDDVAPEVSVAAGFDLLRRGSFAVGLEAQGHFVYTDVGNTHRVLRPLGVFALTLSWER
jgi:hypothetical protein